MHAHCAAATLLSAVIVDKEQLAHQHYLLTSFSNKEVDLPVITQLQSVHALTFSYSTLQVKGEWRFGTESSTTNLLYPVLQEAMGEQA